MHMTTIGIKKNDYKIKNYILSKLESMNKENLDIIFEDYLDSDILFIKCSLKEGLLSKIKDSKAYDDLIYDIAVILSDVIINNYESMLIKKVIKDYCIYITDIEKAQIFEFADKLIKNEDNIYDGFFYKQSRKAKVKKSILSYLKTENLIILDGFVNFRLNEYVKELYVIVDKAVEEFVTQKEYNEFIKLLRYFVEIQESKMDTIHIVVEKNGGYVLLDGKKSIVSYENSEDFRPDMASKEINYDDILISNLITIAPKKIYIHNIDGFVNKELMQTIQNVFYDRIEICLNCQICGFGSIKTNSKLNKCFFDN